MKITDVFFFYLNWKRQRKSHRAVTGKFWTHDWWWSCVCLMGWLISAVTCPPSCCFRGHKKEPCCKKRCWQLIKSEMSQHVNSFWQYRRLLWVAEVTNESHQQHIISKPLRRRSIALKMSPCGCWFGEYRPCPGWDLVFNRQSFWLHLGHWDIEVLQGELVVLEQAAFIALGVCFRMRQPDKCAHCAMRCLLDYWDFRVIGCQDN